MSGLESRQHGPTDGLQNQGPSIKSALARSQNVHSVLEQQSAEASKRQA